VLPIFPVWEIVGNDIPSVPQAVDGNDMSADSMSKLFEKADSKLVSEESWTMDGNPHDMGTRDAKAGIARRTMAPMVNAVSVILFNIFLPSSIWMVWVAGTNILVCL
jgi:hypothetical protein